MANTPHIFTQTPHTTNKYYFSLFKCPSCSQDCLLQNREPEEKNDTLAMQPKTHLAKICDFLGSKYATIGSVLIASTVWYFHKNGLKFLFTNPLSAVWDLTSDICFFSFCASCVSSGPLKPLLPLILLASSGYYAKRIDLNID
jgi:hypothetical protein